MVLVLAILFPFVVLIHHLDCLGSHLVGSTCADVFHIVFPIVYRVFRIFLP